MAKDEKFGISLVAIHAPYHAPLAIGWDHKVSNSTV